MLGGLPGHYKLGSQECLLTGVLAGKLSLEALWGNLWELPRDCLTSCRIMKEYFWDVWCTYIGGSGGALSFLISVLLEDDPDLK